ISQVGVVRLGRGSGALESDMAVAVATKGASLSDAASANKVTAGASIAPPGTGRARFQKENNEEGVLAAGAGGRGGGCKTIPVRRRHAARPVDAGVPQPVSGELAAACAAPG